MNYPLGLDPYAARQHLLYHMYSPLISIQSSYNADSRVQQILGNDSISFLILIRPYGNNAKYGVPNQSFKTTNTQLITKSYPSFPVRFEASFPELLSIGSAWKNTSLRNSDGIQTSHIPQLFSISSLEMLLRHHASLEEESLQDLYLKLFGKVITSNSVVPFETFNHPVSQIFVIDMHNDTLESLRKSIVDFRNHTYPRFFQLDDLLVHVIFLYDDSEVSEHDVTEFQNNLREKLSVQSTALAMRALTTEKFVEIYKNENSTIEQDMQDISINENSRTKGDTTMNKVPEEIDFAIRSKLNEFINAHLIPHMEKKVRLWDDQILAPKKSITGRFFSVSKKIFNSNESTLSSGAGSSGSFNYIENSYHKSSPEQKIRKLADWSLILKDFKYAYSTYDLIKKDYTNDKAWVYVAATQEMCIVSLLLAQTQVNNLTKPDKNTIRKIKIDIIEPYLDNLTYTFKSRLNLRSYIVKTLLVVIELILCMCMAYNIFWWWSDFIEKYLCKCINEFDSHLGLHNPGLQVIRAILYERLGYSAGKGILLPTSSRHLLDLSPLEENHKEVKTKVDRSLNPYKLVPDRNNGIMGFTRYRRSSLWYLLAIREWLAMQNKSRVEKSIRNIRLQFNINQVTDEWYDRNDLLLSLIKSYLNISS